MSGGVSNGQYANEDTFNNAFFKKTADEETILAKTKLANTLPESGPEINNLQKAVNKIFDTVGIDGEDDGDALEFASNFFINDGETHKQALENLDAGLGQTAQDLDDLEELVDDIANAPFTFTGLKQFLDGLISSVLTITQGLFLDVQNNAQTGADVTLTAPTAPIVRLTGVTITSIEDIAEVGGNQVLWLLNTLATEIIIKHGVGIRTPTGGDIPIPPLSMMMVVRDETSDFWYVSSGAGGGALKVYTIAPLDGTAGIVTTGSEDRQLLKVQSTGGEKDLGGYAVQLTNGTKEGQERILVGQNNDDYVILKSAGNISISHDWKSHLDNSLTLVWQNAKWCQAARRD